MLARLMQQGDGVDDTYFFLPPSPPNLYKCLWFYQRQALLISMFVLVNELPAYRLYLLLTSPNRLVMGFQLEVRFFSLCIRFCISPCPNEKGFSISIRGKRTQDFCIFLVYPSIHSKKKTCVETSGHESFNFIYLDVIIYLFICSSLFYLCNHLFPKYLFIRLNFVRSLRRFGPQMAQLRRIVESRIVSVFHFIIFTAVFTELFPYDIFFPALKPHLQCACVRKGTPPDADFFLRALFSFCFPPLPQQVLDGVRSPGGVRNDQASSEGENGASFGYYIRVLFRRFQGMAQPPPRPPCPVLTRLLRFDVLTSSLLYYIISSLHYALYFSILYFTWSTLLYDLFLHYTLYFSILYFTWSTLLCYLYLVHSIFRYSILRGLLYYIIYLYIIPYFFTYTLFYAAYFTILSIFTLYPLFFYVYSISRSLLSCSILIFLSCPLFLSSLL